MAKFYVMTEFGNGKPIDIVRSNTRGEAFRAYAKYLKINTMETFIDALSVHDSPYMAYAATGEGEINFYKDGKPAGTGKLGYVPSEPILFSDDSVFLDSHPFDADTGKQLYDIIDTENFTKGETEIDGSKYSWEVDISDVPYINADEINNTN